jgi:hypothetical protein
MTGKIQPIIDRFCHAAVEKLLTGSAQSPGRILLDQLELLLCRLARYTSGPASSRKYRDSLDDG